MMVQIHPPLPRERSLTNRTLSYGLRDEGLIPSVPSMRVWCLTASMPGFQPVGLGSNPSTRLKYYVVGSGFTTEGQDSGPVAESRRFYGERGVRGQLPDTPN